MPPRARPSTGTTPALALPAMPRFRAASGGPLACPSHRCWLKPRRSGDGWVPVTGLVWLTRLVLASVVGGDRLLFGAGLGRGDAPAAIGFALVLLAAAALLRLVVRRTGPAPRRRWGTSPRDNPDEDLPRSGTARQTD